MMEIISHRGYWNVVDEKNTLLAFRRSFDASFGTETDIRDFNGDIVISHDVPCSSAITLGDFFTLYKASGGSKTLALNVKSDGLQKLLKSILDQFGITNYFVFDMSIPDTIGYCKEGITFYVRQSELEPNALLYDQCKGIWLDSFEDIWYNDDLILEHIRNGKMVAIVSPELHGRDHLRLWKFLKNKNLFNMRGLILCTDFPQLASEYFKN